MLTDDDVKILQKVIVEPLEKRMVSVEGKVDKLTDRVESVEGKVDKLTSDINAIYLIVKDNKKQLEKRVGILEKHAGIN